MLTAADVMTTEVVSVEPDTPVRDIAELLYTRRISGVPVVEHDRVIGIVSEGDLIGHVAAIGEPRRSWWLSLFTNESLSARDYAKTHGRTARDVMTASVISVEEPATLAEIARLVERHRIKRVPVLRDGTQMRIWCWGSRSCAWPKGSETHSFAGHWAASSMHVSAPWRATTCRLKDQP